jgi:hypothetical protein
MKTKNRLPKIFYRMFGVLEVLAPAIGLLVCVLILVLPNFSGGRGNLELELGEVGLVPESGGLVLQSTDTSSPAGSLTITKLRGTVSAKNPGEEIVSLTRAHTLPLIVVYTGFIAVLFDLLRRLFRNVDRGESFNERNVWLVRKIGIALIAFAVLSAAATSWHGHTVRTYLEKHAEVQGIKMTFTAPDGVGLIRHGPDRLEFHLPGNGIIGVLAGLLVLALGEVFRQGFVLRQESELTI